MSTIKGFSILMDMKDVGVDRTLQQIKAQFKTLGSEMNRSNANFKYTERSMESLETRTKDLKKGIDITKNSMENIVAKLKRMTDEERRTSVEAENLRLEYSRQNKALNMYQRQLNQVETEMNQFGQSTKRTIFSMEKIDNVLGTIRKQLNITNMAFERGGKSTKGYENYLNSLNAVIEKHKRTIQTLESRYKLVARQQGVNSREALELRQKILQEKQSLDTLEKQYQQSAVQAKRFAMEQKTATLSMSQIRQKITQVAQSLKISANNFKLSGQTASSYKAKIESLNNSMKQQRLIVQNLSKQYDYAKQQYGATSKEAQELALQLSEERIKLKSLSTELNNTTQAHKRLKMEQQLGISSMSQLKNKMSDINNTLTLSRSNFSKAGESVSNYKNHLITLKNAMTQQKTVLRELQSQYNFVANAQGKNSQEARELASAIVQQKVRMNELESEIKQTGQAYNNLIQKQREEDALGANAFGRATQSINKHKESIDRAGMAMRNMGSNMSMYVTMPVVAGFGAAIKKGMDFQGQMSRVGAIADASKGQLKAMSDQAVDLGAKTSLSASEVSKGMEELAALGMDANQVMSAMPGVISATEASGADLATTAGIMASSLNSFNLKAGDSGHVADVLAVAANKSAADVQYMGDALKYAGPPANSLGMSLEDTSGAIMAMSNAGLKGEQAGTTLRASLIRLAKPTKQSQAAMDELGISLTDSKGEFVGMPALVGQFQKGLKGMTKEQKLAAVSQVVGTESASGFLAMINAGEGKIDKYSKALKNSDGASKKAAKSMKNNLKGDVEQLGGAFESLAIKITEANGGPLRSITQAITKVISKISELPGPVLSTITVIAGLAAAIGPLLVVTGVMANSITSIASAYTLYKKAMNGATIATKISAVATKIWSGVTSVAKSVAYGYRYAIASLTTSQTVNTLKTKIASAATKTWTVITKGAALATRGLGLAIKFMTGPIGIVITVIGLLVGAIVYLWKNNETFRNFVISAWNKIKDAAISVFGFLKPFIIGVWTGIKTVSLSLWSNMKTAAVSLWNGISYAVKHPIQALKNTLTFIWTGIKVGAVLAWNGIKNAVLSIIKGWLTLVKAYFAVWKTVITAVWNGIKFVSVAIWNGIKNAVIRIVKALVTSVKAIITGVKTIVSVVFNATKAVALRIWNAIKNGVIRLAKLLGTGVRSAINAIKKTIVTIFNAIKSFSIRVWTAIKNKVISLAKGLWNGVKRHYNALKKNIVAIFTVIKNFTYKVWSAIKNKVISLAKTLVNHVKKNFNALKKAITIIFNAVKRFMYKVWTSIKNKVIGLAKTLYNHVKKHFNALKHSISSIFNAVKNFMYRVWTAIKNKVVSIAKKLWNSIKNIFNNMRNGIKNIVNKIKRNLIDSWNSIKNKVVGIVKSLWDKVKNTFSNMKDGIKSFSGKIGDTIKGMVNGIKKGLNALIKGVNWVGGKLGIDKKIPYLSTGTEHTHKQNFIKNGKISRPTLATVNDKGPGNGTGRNGHQELIQRKNKIFAPKGKNVTLPLEKGDKVINGRQTQNLQRQGLVPKLSVGTDPGKVVRKTMLKDAKKSKHHNHASVDAGEMMGQGGAGGAAKEAFKFVSDSINKVSSGSKKTLGSLSSGAKKLLNNTKGALGAAGEWAKKKAGDLMDFVGNPGKLVDKVLSEFGVDFSMVHGEIPKMLWKGMWSKLKEATKSLIGGWLDDASEGDGDGRYIKYLDNITTPYSPNGPPKGYPFSWAHPGIDLPYKYEKVQTPLGGTIKTGEMPNGFGHYLRVMSKPYDAYFGHLSKWLVKNGQRVKPGDTIAISGNTGASTGAHLHFEMNKHGYAANTGHSINPIKWLKSHNGSKGGGSKKASAWRPEVIKALKANGLPTSGAYVNAWIRQIDSESGGNAGAVQHGYTDVNSGGNEARGLVQVIPPTFKAFKLKGHGNIMNGLDNLMAGINYAKQKYGKGGMLSVIGHGHGYASGGLIKSSGWYNIAEGGYPEYVISTDPSKASDSMKLLALAAHDIESKNKSSNNKRPNQLPNINGTNDDHAVLRQMLAHQQEQIILLTKLVSSNQTIADKDFEPSIDKYEHTRQVYNAIDEYNRRKVRSNKFRPATT